jgi:hypothetical protein
MICYTAVAPLWEHLKGAFCFFFKGVESYVIKKHGWHSILIGYEGGNFIGRRSE